VKHKKVGCKNVFILHDVLETVFFFVLRFTCYMFEPLRTLVNYTKKKKKTDKRTSASDLRTFCRCDISDFLCLYVIDFYVNLLLLQISNNAAEVVQNLKL
jgi:hypothetical protein